LHSAQSRGKAYGARLLRLGWGTSLNRLGRMQTIEHGYGHVEDDEVGLQLMREQNRVPAVDGSPQRCQSSWCSRRLRRVFRASSLSSAIRIFGKGDSRLFCAKRARRISDKTTDPESLRGLVLGWNMRISVGSPGLAQLLRKAFDRILLPTHLLPSYERD
jgi:hypothetical protein